MKPGSLDSSGDVECYGFYIFALPFLVLQLLLTQLLSFGFTFLLYFILLLSTALYILLLLIYHVQTPVTCNKPHTLRDAATGRN